MLREERWLGVFDNRVPRKILGPERKEFSGGWRKLHNEDLHNLYSLPNTIRMTKSRMTWAEHVARMREKRNMYTVLVGKPEGKRPLGKARHRWQNNIQMDLKT
jgi:hypothetical protein